MSDTHKVMTSLFLSCLPKTGIMINFKIFVESYLCKHTHIYVRIPVLEGF
jgi:hypothetical protein